MDIMRLGASVRRAMPDGTAERGETKAKHS